MSVDDISRGVADARLSAASALVARVPASLELVDDGKISRGHARVLHGAGERPMQVDGPAAASHGADPRINEITQYG